MVPDTCESKDSCRDLLDKAIFGASSLLVQDYSHLHGMHSCVHAHCEGSMHGIGVGILSAGAHVDSASCDSLELCIKLTLCILHRRSVNAGH